MKSSIHRRVRRRTTQPVTVVNDSNYISRISERKIPRKRYMKSYDLDQDTDNFLSLYGIICMYIFLIIAIIIGGGGIAVCIVYYNSEENTQNWKIGGIILGAVTCIVSVVLMIVTIYKQSRNKPWRHQVHDILLHPENYFSDDSGESTSASDTDSDDESKDDSSEENTQTNDTTITSIPNTSNSLLKTVQNDLVYCLGCNHLHATTDECIKRKEKPKKLPPLKRTKSLHTQRGSNIHKKKDKFNTITEHSIKYSLSNETQLDELGNKSDNLILKPLTNSTAKFISQQPATKIMIVRVPKVAGELVIQPKEH